MKRRQLWFPNAEITVRAAGDEGGPLIEGYGAVFNSPSVDFGGWREFVDPGAFKRTLKNSQNIFSFVNHDPHFVLGRTDNRTLTLAEDQVGLRYQVTPPQTAWATDLLTSMARGDINGSSFMFSVVRERWDVGDDGVQQRHVQEAALYETGPVAIPAYPSSDSGVRSLLAELGPSDDDLDFDVLARCHGRHRAGLALPDAERDLLARTIEALRSILPAAEPTSDPPQAGHSLDWLERQLDALTA